MGIARRGERKKGDVGGGGEGQRGREDGKRMENGEAGEMAGKCMEGGTKEREKGGFSKQNVY